MEQLTHIDAEGRALMVDVTAKPVTSRKAIASGLVKMQPDTLRRITERGIGKGDVMSVAQLAGIMGAKRTADLIPLCHPLGLDAVQVDLTVHTDTDAVGIEITAHCQTTGRTGVEMEAMTAVSIAALTIYDMCKAIDRTMQLTDIRLIHKSGGKSGLFEAC